MVSLPPRPKRRRNETRDLVEPIVVRLNGLPGVRIFRPIVLNKLARSMSGAGLSIGSADLVGLVEVNTCCVGCCVGIGLTRGCFFALEVKWPGKKPKPGQLAWAKMVRDLGGFCAVVHSVDEAVLAVERCRGGESQ